MAETRAAARPIERFANAAPPRASDRALIDEAPVAIEINGIAYAVMMATPADLDDYALGFCLAERLIAAPADVLGVAAAPVPGGWLLRLTLAAPAAAPLLERARVRLAEGSCGLCGIESLAEVLRPLPQVRARLDVPPAAVFAAAANLRAHQPLNRATGAAHAAAWCTAEGNIVLAREDIGRHNAFDKLIGAMARGGHDPARGFALLSARCSFELVQKAIIAGIPMLATVSAASALAVATARAHGLRLLSLVRADSLIEMVGEA